MRNIIFILTSLLTVGLTWILDTHHPFGSSLPRLGMLLSPGQGFWQQAEPSRSGIQRDFAVPGVSAGVEVVFDERLVPHVFAANINDAAFVQGCLTASLRLWQMDLATRAAGGELSELLGEQTLEYDRLQRRKGMVFAAQNFVEALKQNPEETAVLEAYSNGVNAYIQTLSPKEYPLEYKLLNAAPKEWSPLRSALMIKRMSETLASRSLDVQATNTKALIGEEMFDFLFPEVNPKQSPIIPADVQWAFQPLQPERDSTAASARMIGQIWKQPILPTPPPYLGSNNWAVSGAKTASGNPILCNDPHLDLSLPSIWFEIQLMTPQLNAYGVSIPGLPGVLIGFNEHIAWGETNVGQDVLDWYAVKWLDEAKTKYLLDDQPVNVRTVVEEIKVAGRKAPVLDTVTYTVWGPIVYDEPSSPYRDLAMRWLAHDKQEKRPFYEIGSFLRLMEAKNYDEYSAALTGYDVPAQNFVFASRDGDIAIKVNGKFPVRAAQQGRFVQDGSFSGNAWQQFIPRAHIPQVKNPARGFVSSANQHSAAPNYPYYYIGEFDDYRGRILNRLLDSMDNITVKDMMALQYNSYSIVGEEAAPLILKYVKPANAEQKALYEMLQGWDYRYVRESKAPVVVKAVIDSTMRLAFDELESKGEEPELLMPELWRLLSLLEEHPEHAIFDRRGTAQKENAAAVLQEAFAQVTKEWYGPLVEEGKDWGRVNGSAVNHLLRLPAFSRTELYVDGYNNALNATRKGNGPSWRMVVELGNPIKAYGVYPGGQSGNPGSPFYESMVDQWAQGQYNDLHLMKGADDALPKVLQRWNFKKG